MMPDRTKPSILILGGGLGGTLVAYELRATLKDRADVLLVSDKPHYSFVPSNPWVAVGWRQPQSIQVDLASSLERKGIAFNATGARRVLPNESCVELTDGSKIGYDYLVIATGPDLAFDEIEGFGPEKHTISICETGHAERAFTAFERLCEDPRPVIIGAVQGASCFGPAYEFAMMLDTELRRRKLRHKVPITFVTPEPYIGHLGLDGVGDTKSMLESELRGRHIKWITNAKIAGFKAEELTLNRMDLNGAEEVLPFGFAMLLPAFRGVHALQGVQGLVNPRGFVLVDEYQRSPAFPNVFALGVCIAIPPVAPTLVPVGVPKTGFMIEGMAAAIAGNISDLISARGPTHKATWNAVCLADFGDDGVAFIAQPQIPPRNVNWSGRGRWVHLAKVIFEKLFLRKIRRGLAEPAYERLALKVMGVRKLEAKKTSESVP